MLDQVRKIKAEVARKWGFTVIELEGSGRGRTLVYARHEAMYRIRRETPLSYPEIGYCFGRRDHTTILYAVKSFEKKRDKWERVPGMKLIRKE